MNTIRLTMGQALARFLAAQYTFVNGEREPLFAGVFAIFGHGNVAGFGEALADVQDRLPTWRAHNEQAMAHTAIAFAKASNRRRMMACTTSVGPGATNMVTAAALAHVNRLPVLFLPGDTFASRRPDPVLQQVENFGDPTVVANDSFRPVSRYFDRISRPEQLITSLTQAMRILTDPADCGPVTLCLPQDVQAEAYDYPASLFEERVHGVRRQGPDGDELTAAVELLKAAEAPMIIAGGGVHYSGATETLAVFAERHGMPVGETQAGKSALLDDHPASVGGIGVTGTEAANGFARKADVVLMVGTRLSDFTTGSRSLFEREGVRFIGLNVAAFDAVKHRAQPLVSDAKLGLEALDRALGTPKDAGKRLAEIRAAKADWRETIAPILAPTEALLPTDAQVLAVVNDAAGPNDTVVAAAGGLPGELHKLWRAKGVGTYHLEYGFSCMGYEIAGGLGVKMAKPDGDVFVMVGDGSYMMLNSELSTSVLMGRKLIVILLDNGGYGCISRLQKATTGTPFNNLFDVGTRTDGERPVIDFVAHARSLGAIAEEVETLAGLPAAIQRARAADRSTVLVLESDPQVSTGAGGTWWDVPVAEVSTKDGGSARLADYRSQQGKQKIDG
ncbi:MAG: 3D-(3,5/4)-trihydroxycyclohexane-1,2-dione acylhydrolase (decyclizing) [Alphaproteobacteria bacterium]|nr:MAG: 3D-(3,5/4)-trihydroxycyclohexane-1,2-dione acylhydrolase (decyclizing) [Alphaproteobacteria bacterium]